ncbi:hypothetical protein [Thermoactinomyces sp. DSM 45892]|uniref:hypothetical protein n=1 Tax=Thermoactinomyces sp. DSM 45892 TaxID=1882753 RepID=UPI0008979CE3|nr:hypothetical protein [Thermoactinomyces sp. DSM 45892]SDY77342.1 hypothetical protein SAMN05444416_10856 [Thermoactinomyces sp. DSM 45892]
MNTERKSRLSINGAATVDGGRYQEVKVTGQGKINEGLDAIQLTVNGHMEGFGDIITESMTINGKLVAKRDLSAKKAQVNGIVKSWGDLQIPQLRIHGEVTGKKNLISESIHIYGSLKLDGDCNTESFTGKAQFHIDGLLNADQIDISLYGSSSAKEIGGEKIIIKKGKKWNKFLPWLQSDLKVECIEGDYIELENTQAKIVRGKQIVIGKDCTIDRIEYQDSYTSHTDSKVGEAVKI